MFSGSIATDEDLRYQAFVMALQLIAAVPGDEKPSQDDVFVLTERCHEYLRGQQV